MVRVYLGRREGLGLEVRGGESGEVKKGPSLPCACPVCLSSFHGILWALYHSNGFALR